MRISLLRIWLLRFFKTITKIWLMRCYRLFILLLRTLESVIDVGQGISVGPGIFGKNNRRRALNKRRAWKIWKKE